MSLLDDIIDGATNDAVSTSNLLRKVQVVAHRLGATELTEWVSNELNGYPDTFNLPPYRYKRVQVMGVWAGPMGARMQQVLSPGGMPTEDVEILFNARLHYAVAEFEEMVNDSDQGSDIAIPWDPLQVVQYNNWAERGIVPTIEFFGLLSAHRVLSRGLLHAVVDAARNTALGFALDLQAAAPDAGSTGGPTMAEAPVAQVVNHYITNNITGDGTQVAQGHDIRQKMVVERGDLAGLLTAAKEFGLAQDGAQELARVVVAAPEERPARMERFLDAVRSGTFAIGTAITADVAASQLAELIDAYLG